MKFFSLWKNLKNTSVTGPKRIDSVSRIRGKRFFVRLDLDAPVAGGVVVDDLSIKKSLKTLEYIRNAGGRMILCGHIGRDAKNTLEPVYRYINSLFPIKSFIRNYFPEFPTEEINALKDGEAILLENIRKYPEELDNSESFGKHLASFADIFVNEAFAVSHRSHASVVGIPRFIPGYAGFVLDEEIKNLSIAFNPPRPFLFILGGAKFETKIPLIEKFLARADYVFVGGAIANNFFKEKGFEIGTSVTSGGDWKLLEILKNPKLILPTDVVVSDGNNRRIVMVDKVLSREKILDVGPESLKSLERESKKAKFILWNGPLGDFEHGFAGATDELAKILAESRADSIIGGGDTVSSIQALNLLEDFSFVSTGGGAMLDFLTEETLPGIEAIKKSF